MSRAALERHGCLAHDGYPWHVLPMRSAVCLVLFALLGCSGEDDPGSEESGQTGATTDPATGSGSGPGSGSATGDDDATSTGSSGGSTTADSESATDSSAGTRGDTEGMCDKPDFDAIGRCPDPVGTAYCSEGVAHVPAGSAIDWNHNPPHSGPHYPSWQAWGEHLEAVPRGYWVHNLEHGGVVLLYRCDPSCNDELGTLREVLAQRPELRILLTPDPELDGPRFAAVSWQWVLETDAPTVAELLCFVDQHEGHAPEDVP